MTNLPPWPLQLQVGTKDLFMRWLPVHSCAHFGCITNDWFAFEDTNDKSINVCLTITNSTQADMPCFCDDACTRYKDCCYDYSWSCRISVDFPSSMAYEPGSMVLP